MAWTSDWPPEASAESVARAQVKAISPEWPEGVDPGCTPPRPHLRADSQGGWVSIWRSLLLEPFCEPRTQVSSLFHYSFVSAIISLVLYLYTLQAVYLFAIHPVTSCCVNMQRTSSRGDFSRYWLSPSWPPSPGQAKVWPAEIGTGREAELGNMHASCWAAALWSAVCKQGRVLTAGKLRLPQMHCWGR